MIYCVTQLSASCVIKTKEKVSNGGFILVVLRGAAREYFLPHFQWVVLEDFSKQNDPKLPKVRRKLLCQELSLVYVR